MITCEGCNGVPGYHLVIPSFCEWSRLVANGSLEGDQPAFLSGSSDPCPETPIYTH